MSTSSRRLLRRPQKAGRCAFRPASSTHSLDVLQLPTHTRCGEGNNRGSSSGPKPTTVRRRSPCSHRGYSTKDMCGSSSGGCVKTSASPVHPSMWRSDLGRSGRGSEQFCRRNGSTLMYFFGSPSDPNGLWRSLVAHLTGGQGVAGSNPVSPTF